MNGQHRYRRNERVVARELDETRGAVLLHLDTGAYHGLNPVGFLVWELLASDRTLDELVSGVREAIPGAPTRVEADVHAFLDSAVARDLVTVA